MNFISFPLSSNKIVEQLENDNLKGEVACFDKIKGFLKEILKRGDISDIIPPPVIERGEVLNFPVPTHHQSQH